jgi:hypothetical protein
MMEEPRFFGDVMPPDDPRPGDCWLANGVYRVRIRDRWEPEFKKDLTAYEAMLRATWHRAGLKARATRARRKVNDALVSVTQG